jgi:protein-S-isoprenylcysteine O-methyltransferase Ste14
MRKGPSALDVIFLLVQVALIVLYFWRPEFVDVNLLGNLAKVIGAVPILIGMIMIIWSLVLLQNSFSFLATPREGGELVTRGIYRHVRHPIYSGIIMLAVGFSFFDLEDGLRRMFITLLLLLFFHFKAGYEERGLEKLYPDYAAYRSRTGKFLPYFIRFRMSDFRNQPTTAESQEPGPQEEEIKEPPMTWGDG